MALTKDGHDLRVGDSCFLIFLEEDSGYIKDSIKCFYRGTGIRDNSAAIASLPPSCSGVHIPTIETTHNFEHVDKIDCIDVQFDLLECEVKQTIIKDMSSTEEVTRKRLKS